jgi:putative aminopeptidase FrvX
VGLWFAEVALYLHENKIKLPFWIVHITNSVQEEMGLRCRNDYQDSQTNVAIVTDVCRFYHSNDPDKKVEGRNKKIGKGRSCDLYTV